MCFEKLKHLMLDFIRCNRGLRSSRVNDLFKRVCWITPERVVMLNYLIRKPVALFNPAAILSRDSKSIYVFPRIIFGYYWYSSSIGVFKLNIEDLLSGEIQKPIGVKLILWPSESWDLGGCEDPRVIEYNSNYLLLYTAIKPSIFKFHIYGGKSLQGIALLDNNFNLIWKNFFKLTCNSNIVDIEEFKDSAILKFNNNSISLLTRLCVDGVRICWFGLSNFRDFTVNIDSLKPVLSIEDWEERIGWSTNAIKLSSNEYLVGWHGVSKYDYMYRNGFAIISSDGDLLAITPEYVLAPKETIELYGDRPGVIFGDGLILYKDLLVWIGGVGDYVIGIYTVNLERLMECLKWLRG